MDYLELDDVQVPFLAWPGLDYQIIDSNSLEKQCPLDNGRHQPIVLHDNTTAHISMVGDLECLPLEIIHMVLGILDLQTLTNFRAVSWHARNLVDSLPAYRAIVKHSPNALRALISTQTAIQFTARDIFRTLCTEACFNCGKFGPFLDLLSGERYCQICVAECDHLYSMRASLAKKAFGLDAKTMRSLPKLISLPGEYSMRGTISKKRITLVRMLSAEAAEQSMRATTSDRALRTTVARLSRQPPSTANDLLQMLDLDWCDPFRHMAMVRIPVLRKDT